MDGLSDTGQPGPAAGALVDVDADAERAARPVAPSVLIVDDSPAERLALKAILSPLGFRIVEAASGRDALREATRENFAVILLDVRMPSMGGLEVASIIRSRERTTRTPIIFVTALDRAEREMALGYAMGAVDFIFAPVVGVALRAKVTVFTDLFSKTQELVEHARQLRGVAIRAAETLGLQREMLHRSEELDRAKTDFVSRVSHELRSPLTSIIGYVEMLIDDGEKQSVSAEQRARMLAIIDRNSRRLLALIQDLLTMSRAEAGTLELDVGPVDIAEVVQNVRETITPDVATAGLHLSVDLDRDSLTFASALTGDRAQLERALLNLVSNAVGFTEAGGDVEIATRVRGNCVAVSVRDTGMGVPFEQREKLFTKFGRGASSQRQQIPGTGLGLYIVKQIVDLHGGSMELESEPGAGSTFTMLLPLGSAPVGDPPSG